MVGIAASVDRVACLGVSGVTPPSVAVTLYVRSEPETWPRHTDFIFGSVEVTLSVTPCFGHSVLQDQAPWAKDLGSSGNPRRRAQSSRIVVFPPGNSSVVIPRLMQLHGGVRLLCMPDGAKPPTASSAGSAAPEECTFNPVDRSSARLRAATDDHRMTSSQMDDLKEGIACLRAAFVAAQSARETNGADDLPVLIISHQGADDLADEILADFLEEFSVSALFDPKDEIADRYTAFVDDDTSKAQEMSRSMSELIRMSSFCQRHGLNGTAEDFMTLALRRHIMGGP